MKHPHPRICRPPGRRHSSGSRHAGLTLYEVVLALAILLGSLLVLGQQVSNGSRAARDARLRTTAAILCRSRLAEMRVEALPLQSTGETPLPDDDGRWTWSAVVGSGPLEELLSLSVSVAHTNAAGEIDHRYSLSQWIRDPAALADAATAADSAGATP